MGRGEGMVKIALQQRMVAEKKEKHIVPTSEKQKKLNKNIIHVVKRIESYGHRPSTR